MKTFVDQWQQLRKKGKAKYILIHGLLLWGLPMSLVANTYLHFRGGIPWTPMIYYTTPIFLTFSLLFGLFMWKFLENRYNKLK